jgi:hypothetical protein
MPRFLAFARTACAFHGDPSVLLGDAVSSGPLGPDGVAPVLLLAPRVALVEGLAVVGLYGLADAVACGRADAAACLGRSRPGG